MYSLIMLGIIALVILLCAGHAALFGLSRAKGRLSLFLGSAVAAVSVCLILKQLLPSAQTATDLVRNNLDFITAKFGVDVAAIAEQALEYANISPTLVELVIQLAGALVFPLLCVLLFFIFAAISWIVFAIVYGIINHKNKKREQEEMDDDYEPARPSALSRVFAAGLGVVQGAVIIAVLFLPISGYFGLAQPTIDELCKQGVLDSDNTVVAGVQDVVDEVNTSPVLGVYRTLGGKALTDAVMSVRVADQNVKLSEELPAVITLAEHVVELSKTEFENYGEEEAAIIRSIGDAFGDSALLSPIVGDILYAATDAWLNGEAFLGIERPSMGDSAALLDPLVTALLEILHDDAREAVLLQADIRTTAEMIAIMAQNGVFANLSDTDKLLGTLGGDVVSSLVTVLGSNDSMKRLVPEVMNLGVRAIGQVLNVPLDTAAVYNNFMDSVADTLNDVRALPEQERIQTLSTELESAFDNAGLDVDSQVLDFYSTAILHDLVEQNDGDVTPEDVQAFFIVYAESVRSNSSALAGKPTFDLLSDNKAADPFAGTVYQGMTDAQRRACAAAVVAELCVKLTQLEEGESTAEQAKTLVTETFTELLGSDHAALEVVSSVEITAPLPASAFENTASMQSAEQLKQTSTVITLETLLVDAKEAALKINAETIGADAEAISAIFSTATNLLDTLGGSDAELNITDLANSVGTILDSLSKTDTFGQDKTAALFTSVLQSETVREKANLDMKTATQIADKATEGEVNYTQTMTAIAGSVNVMEKLAEDGTISEEELVDLIKNLNPQTAGMIEVYVTPERLVENDIPEKHAPLTSELIKSLFSYMGREDLKDYDAEAKALNQVLQIGLEAKKSDDKQLFSSAPGADDGKLPTATETVNTLLGSDAVQYALVDVLTDGNKVTVFDPYGLGEKITEGSDSYVEFVGALEAYRNAHPEVDDLVFEALGALLGIEVDF